MPRMILPQVELIAGVDEAGRGPLAGPVVAAAVILDPENPIEGLKDSKKLTAAKRKQLFKQIRQCALAWSVAQARVREIDSLNILQASLLAMHRAVDGLKIRPQKVLIDGNQLPKFDYDAQCVVGGDNLEPAISAASIVAKVLRDRLMHMLDRKYPMYGFAGHKGYPTPTHLELLKQHGPIRVHRRSFAPVANCLRSNLESD